MLDEMTAREVTEQAAFLAVNGPIGDERADWRIGNLAAQLSLPYLREGAEAPEADSLRLKFKPQVEDEPEERDSVEREAWSEERGASGEERKSVKPAPGVATTPGQMMTLLKKITQKG